MDITGGDEIQVNTYTTDTQSSAVVTSLADGGWVVAWRSLSQDGDDWGIYQQRYGASGNPLGGEVHVSSTTVGAQMSPDITMLKDGGWLVVWRTDNGNDIAMQYGISQQRYDSKGQPVGGEVTVAALSSTELADPSVIELKDGGWLVSWTSDSADGNGAGVAFNRYSSTGALVSGPVLANTETANDQDYSTITALKGGGWVVTYSSNGYDGSGWGISQHVFDSDGLSVGNAEIVNLTTAGTQLYPRSAALDDGGWVVTWADGFGSSSEIYMRRYDSKGVTSGADIHVNTVTTGVQSSPQVVGLTNGGWVVAWSDNSGGSYDVRFQVYDSKGDAVGSNMLANLTTDYWQYMPDIAALPDGKFVIAWESDKQDGDDYGIVSRVFDSDGTVEPPDPSTNHPPVANPDKAKVGEYGSVRINVLKNDTDVDGDPISVTSAKVLAGDGSVTINRDHTLTYDAASHVWDIDKGQHDTARIRYTISDGETASTTTVTITINGVTADVRGTSRANDLVGTRGADVIEGLGGKDRIDGGKGADTLVGGSGVDTFLFRTGSGKDVIIDFEAGGRSHDVLNLKGLDAITSFRDLTAHHVSEQGHDVLINAGHGDSILLKNVALDDLGKADFLF